MKQEILWVCTDPDNEQYGRKLYDRHYEFKELNPFNEINDEGEWVQIDILLDQYSEKEIDSVARTYYGSIDELKDQCGDSWEWVLAECIFEQESGLY